MARCAMMKDLDGTNKLCFEYLTWTSRLDFLGTCQALHFKTLKSYCFQNNASHRV